MWKRGGRSSALDRAQALLSAKRSSRGDVQSAQGSAANTQGVMGGSVKARSAFPNAHILLSDLSDLSSDSSAPGDSTKDLRSQSSPVGGGSRFLKKAPPPASDSHLSSDSKNQMQQVLVPRNVSSSVRGSQTAALTRLAQIESRFRSRKQAGQEPKPAENLTSDVGISQPAAAQALEASVELSAQSSSDHSFKGKRFLKNTTSAAMNNANTAAVRPPQPRAAEDVVPSVGLETKRAVSGVSLESDEEDMRKLLGDLFDSVDNRLLIPGKPASIRTSDKMFGKGSQRVYSPPPPTAVAPSSSSDTSAPRSPTPPSCHSSPFRFISQAHPHFSPSVLSPSPSPPYVSSSFLGRLNSPHNRAGSPQRSLSSMSGRSEVLSLEELFPVGPGSEGPHSERSAVSSEDFKIKVMTLDDLVPANLGFREETPGKEAKLGAPPASLNRQQLLRMNEEQQQQEQQQQQQQEEVVLDYRSDFESVSRTEPDDSASLVSEHLQVHEDEEEVVSEVRQEDTGMSCVRTDEDFSRSLSDTSRSNTPPTSDHSQTLSRSRGSRSSGSRSSQTFSRQSRRRTSTRKALKDAAVQTQPDLLLNTRPTGVATFGPAVDMTYMDPTPVVAHTLGAEMVEALSTFNPAAFAVNELLKQQLAMIRRFIESSRYLHSSLVQSLEPPNYRYATLEDTKEYIRKFSRLKTEEASEEVLQEMRVSHHV